MFWLCIPNEKTFVFPTTVLVTTALSLEESVVVLPITIDGELPAFPRGMPRQGTHRL